jgi:uncharacterized protein YuzB (UPF0349 family)
VLESRDASMLSACQACTESRFFLLLLEVTRTESRVKLLVNSEKVTIHE